VKELNTKEECFHSEMHLFISCSTYNTCIVDLALSSFVASVYLENSFKLKKKIKIPQKLVGRVWSHCEDGLGYA